MKIWVDDIRPAPDNSYIWIKTVDMAIHILCLFADDEIELLDLDHDAGCYADYGGDYIKILDWLELKHRNIPIRIHSMNVVGRENMRAIIQHNNWEEIF